MNPISASPSCPLLGTALFVAIWLPHAHSRGRPGGSKPCTPKWACPSKDASHLSSRPAKHPKAISPVTLSLRVFHDLAQDLVPLVDLVVHVQLVVFLFIF